MIAEVPMKKNRKIDRRILNSGERKKFENFLVLALGGFGSAICGVYIPAMPFLQHRFPFPIEKRDVRDGGQRSDDGINNLDAPAFTEVRHALNEMIHTVGAAYG